MLVKREPTMSRDAATADVAGPLTELADLLLGLRSSGPAQDEGGDADR
jgi:hypothetical protein